MARPVAGAIKPWSVAPANRFLRKSLRMLDMKRLVPLVSAILQVQPGISILASRPPAWLGALGAGSSAPRTLLTLLPRLCLAAGGQLRPAGLAGIPLLLC